MITDLLWPWTVSGVLLLLVLLFAFIGAQYLARGSPMESIRVLGAEETVAAGDPRFSRSVSLHVNTELRPGHRIELLLNGDGTYPRLFDDITAATTLVTWHVFWYRPGRLADRVHQALSERARAGVRVLMLYDAYGSMGLRRDYWDDLRSAGVEVAPFRPLRWNTLYKVQQRSHMRAVVIDGRVGYTGGLGIDDHWLGDGRSEGCWRDTNVRLEGPAVHQLQGAFAANWTEATGQLLTGPEVFPGDGTEEPGENYAGIAYTAPSIGSTDAERMFALTISGARRELFITNAYFIPDDDFRRLLREAVERGVDVRVLTPGANTDKPSTWFAGRCHYDELLTAGVRIWEYRPTMVHAKTMVVDGVWSTVGTHNFDNRSMVLNDEVGVMVHDEEFAGRLRSAFLEDLEHAAEVGLEGFRGRGRFERAKERWWVLWSRAL